MPKPITRRVMTKGLLAGVLVPGGITAKSSAIDTAVPQAETEHLGKASRSWDVIVVGAGVFGAWTAHHLQQAGKRVLLLDASGPGNSKASSGGESRMTRAVYGPDEVYTRMAHAALPQWKVLSDEADLPLFHPHGVLFFFQRRVDYAEASVDVHRRLGLSLEVIDRKSLETRYPQADWSGVEFALFEAGFGALMARRAVQMLVDRFVERGGSYETALALTPTGEDPPTEVRTAVAGVSSASRSCTPAVRGSASSFPKWWEGESFQLGRPAHSFRSRRVTDDSVPTVYRVGQIGTMETSSTAFPTSRREVSRSPSINTEKRSIRIPVIDRSRRERSLGFAST